jgi:ketosteroid isomerase-like protein
MFTGFGKSWIFGKPAGAVLSGCWVGMLLLSGCAKAPVAADPKAAERAVKDADMKWAQAAKAHDMNTVLLFYAIDAVVLPANGEMQTSKSAAQKVWMDLLTKDVDVSWTPMYVEAAKSADMVYDFGSYTMTTKVEKGKPIVDHGKYMAVWKKQEDGSWKAEADTWNSDLPVPGKKAKA